MTLEHASSTPESVSCISLRTGLRADAHPEALTLDPAQPWAEVKPRLAALLAAPALRIVFSKPADGRGYSLAARLREAGYRGLLIASGGLHIDLVYYLRRTGFEVAEFPAHLCPDPDGLPAQHRRSLLSPFAQHYQAGADHSPGLLGQGQAHGHSTGHAQH